MTAKERKHQWYLKNKELTKARAAAWKEKNRKPARVPELLSNTDKAYKRQEINPRGVIWSRARSTALTRGHEFNLEIEDIVLPEVCPYLGIPLQFNRGCKANNSYSLDRIDSSKGYVSGNVEVISDLANRMKNNATIEEQINFAKAVLKKYGVSDTD